MEKILSPIFTTALSYKLCPENNSSLTNKSTIVQIDKSGCVLLILDLIHLY